MHPSREVGRFRQWTISRRDRVIANVLCMSEMFSWLRAKPDLSDGSSRIANDHHDLTRNIFFRIPDGHLRDAEIGPNNEDVPPGVAILQAIFYSYHPDWTLHELKVSVWHHTATATLGRGETDPDSSRSTSLA